MKRRFNIFQFTLLLGIAVFLSACQGTSGAFGPVKPTPTLIGIFDQQSVPVNFETLNSDPTIFIDKYIQVTGRYIPLRQQQCERQRGPSVDWFLISDELEMNMSGFSSVVGIVPEQAFFTVEGIWRRYDGPVGCAKDPTEETVWYLEIVRIVDPNPIIASAFSADSDRFSQQPILIVTESGENGGASGVTPSSDVATPTPNIQSTPTSTPLPNENNDGQSPLTPTATLQTVPTRSSSTLTPTATLASGSGGDDEPTETPTLSAGEQEMTPTATATPTNDASGGGLGETGEGTPNPSTPVPEPGGNYPSPYPTP